MLATGYHSQLRKRRGRSVRKSKTIAHDIAGVQFFDRPRRWEAASSARPPDVRRARLYKQQSRRRYPKRLKQSFLRSPDRLKVPLELKIMTMRRGTVLGSFD